MALRLWFAAFLLVGVSFRAAAQPRPGDVAVTTQPTPAAREAFELGKAAYERGRFSEALAYYERAYALSPHPNLLFNIGRAADSDGRSERAIQAYSAFLEAVPDADNREFVEGRLERLRAPSARVDPSAVQASISPYTAAATASAAESTPSAAVPLARYDDRKDVSPPAWKRAWFWAVIGAVVVTGVTVGVVATRGGDDRPKADLRVRALEANW